MARNAPPGINPYAPPPQLPTHDEFFEGGVFRDRQRLVIHSGAALPPRCFVSGQKTRHAVEVRQRWQPRWVYLFLLPGILPYYFVSPHYTRYVTLKVPIAEQLLAAHLRMVWSGLFLLGMCGLMALVAFLLTPFPQLSHSFMPLTYLPTAVLALIGFLLASSPPSRLDIEHMDESWLILRGVHPNCLESLPEWKPELQLVSPDS